MTAPAPTLYGDAVEFAGLTFDGRIHERAKWVVDSIVGWKETPELTYVANNHPNRDGASWAEGGRFFRPRACVIEGYIAADNRADMEAAQERLKAAAISKAELLLVKYETVPKQLRVRFAGQVTFPEEVEDACRFSVPVLAPDPFKESLQPTSLSLSMLSPVRWTRQYPRSYPMAYNATPYEIEVVTDRNYVPDPSFEAAASGWSRVGTSGTITRAASPGTGLTHRTTDLRLDVPAGGSVTARSTRFAITGLRSGDFFRLSAEANCPASPDAATVQATVRFYSEDNNLVGSAISTQPTVIGAGNTPMQALDYVPNNAAVAEVEFVASSAGAVSVYLATVMLNELPDVPYFDGESASVRWSGIPDGSMSLKYVMQEVDTSSEVAVFNNLGNWNDWPISKVTGPLNVGWRIRNATTGLELGFNFGLEEGQTVTIDHRRQMAILNTGSRVEAAYFGTWWPLVPGENRLDLYAPSYNPDARWDLEPRSRWA